MSKPTEIVDWAEGAGAQTSEPVNERAGGFPFRYVPPAEQVNWMWRAVGRWINWLQNKADNHVRRRHHRFERTKGRSHQPR